MKPKKRQKLCYNCEGEIDVDVIVCPFCAADLREEKPEQKISSYTSSVRNLNDRENIQPLYPPASSYKAAAIEFPPEEEEAESILPTADEKKEKNIFVPTILFTLGVQLCLLGLLMLLSSHKGMVVLKWDARFWFFYVAFSIPFLVFGYKTLSKV